MPTQDIVEGITRYKISGSLPVATEADGELETIRALLKQQVENNQALQGPLDYNTNCPSVQTWAGELA